MANVRTRKSILPDAKTPCQKAERFLRSLLRCAPPRVVYVSCDPETLARDLGVLVKGGYRVKGIQPVDMFPFTEHIECVVKLEGSRQK